MQCGDAVAGRMLRSATLLFGLAALVAPGRARSQEPWQCPPDTASSASRVVPTVEALAKGQRLAHQSCAECHGETGLGDGPAAASINPRPASWRTRQFQAQ